MSCAFVSVQSFVSVNTKMRLDVACRQMRLSRNLDYAETFEKILELGISALSSEHCLVEYRPIEFEASSRG